MSHDDTPRVVAIVACDAIYRDTGSGKVTLLGIFNAVSFPKENMCDICVYLAMSGIRGSADIQVRLVRIDKELDAAPMDKADLTMRAESPVAVVDTAGVFRRVSFPETGTYRFAVRYNDSDIAWRDIEATERQP